MAKKKMVVTNNSSRGGYFIRRVLAFGIDWYLSGVLANIAISLCYGFFNQGQIEVQYNLNGMTSSQAWILMAVLFLILLRLGAMPDLDWSDTCSANASDQGVP